jgi:hypothetical protein
MIFGEWNEAVHNSEEQLKRIEKAKSGSTTPLAIDSKNKVGTFKGSGNNPYSVTLTSCTCGDFINRFLPCKHIYRLAMELKLIQTDYEKGINKNNLIENLEHLSLGSKFILSNMVHTSLNSTTTSFFLRRSNFTQEIYQNGFCIEALDNYGGVASQFSGGEIKNELYNTSIDNLPPYKTTKPKLVKFISNLEHENNQELQKHIIILEFTQQTIELKHTIHRRLYKVFNNGPNSEKIKLLDYLLENRLISESDYNYRKDLLEDTYQLW